MSSTIPFRLAGVLPEPEDNVAIASQELPGGTVITDDDRSFTLSHTVREGHRFVVHPIAEGEALLSWNTPFARALRDLEPGDYVCTETSLETLRARGLPDLPDTPAAHNEALDAFALDEDALNLGEQVPPAPEPRTFPGYLRSDGRVGTRNHIAVIGATSREAAFVTEVARQFAGRTSDTFDGVVAVAHTEAGESTPPNNLEFVLTVLAGCIRHPNLGGVLFVDSTGGQVSAAMVQQAIADQGRGEIDIPHAFVTRSGGFSDDVAACAATIEGWIDEVSTARRSEQSVGEIKVALQCGGSDAFSGVSANPLAGRVGAEFIKHGGVACLAETDELIGAEGYVLKNVRSTDVARRFLERVEAFKERVGKHGATAEGNPSGGNVYRGLYNIVLKSIGAARKLPREVRLDDVIRYGQPLTGPGYIFMDSPGNDLESVAGQVASGCNLIFFTTGNGSITNFPFVPTLKFVTTSSRFELLHNDMDVDAGRYLTGESMDDLTQEVFDQAIRVASGERSVGERAGHSQVSIWRNWRQGTPEPRASEPVHVALGRPVPMDTLVTQTDPDLPGVPLDVPVRETDRIDVALRGWANQGRLATESLALVLPTSLCSGQIAARIAGEAGEGHWDGGHASRIVALPHTEGCGSSSGDSEKIYARTMVGYLAHPNVRWALLLEHGCEKTHNDYFRTKLTEAGLDTSRYGYASIQADGGIASVSERVKEWFEEKVAEDDAPEHSQSGLGGLTLAFGASGNVSDATGEAFARFGRAVVADGGSVVVTDTSPLWESMAFLSALGLEGKPEPTIAHGQRITNPGWHVMRGLSSDWLENITGLGATGAELAVAACAEEMLTGHRLVPLLRVGDQASEDLDVRLDGSAEGRTKQLVDLVVATVNGDHQPVAHAQHDEGFQITRGLLGTSM